jgi:shikimate kinase
MKLILISGAEATCKSAIGKTLADKLNYEYSPRKYRRA